MNEREIEEPKSRLKPFIVFVVILVAVVIIGNFLYHPPKTVETPVNGNTNVTVEPGKTSVSMVFGEGIVSSNDIHVGDVFAVSISCQPDEPIKAFEFKLSFNPIIVQALLVEEGNIFSGYQTFFNKGIIDNTNGTINDIYNLIVGQGNVTHVGTFVDITFIASAPGSTMLDMYDEGVTNETTYVDISVVDGNVVVLR